MAERNDYKARRAGAEAGHNAATWVFDGNTDESAYRRILEGIEDGDPEIMDMEPSPLSGEMAGESIPELSAQYGIPLDDPDVADAFENAFSQAYWAEVERAARYQVGADVDGSL